MLSEFYHRFFLIWKDPIQILVRKSVLVEIAKANTVRRFTTESLITLKKTIGRPGAFYISASNPITVDVSLRSVRRMSGEYSLNWSTVC